MIRRCANADFPAVEAVINEAAQGYRGVIPADCWHEPYMTGVALKTEVDAGVNFWGWEESRTLIGVMGIQPVREVTLIRHAYVRTRIKGEESEARCLPSLRTRRGVHCWSAHGPRLSGQSVSTSGMDFAWSRRQRRTDFSAHIGVFPHGREKRR